MLIQRGNFKHAYIQKSLHNAFCNFIVPCALYVSSLAGLQKPAFSSTIGEHRAQSDHVLELGL